VRSRPSTGNSIECSWSGGLKHSGCCRVEWCRASGGRGRDGGRCDAFIVRGSARSISKHMRSKAVSCSRVWCSSRWVVGGGGLQGGAQDSRGGARQSTR
jgi:hypothetical protein